MADEPMIDIGYRSSTIRFHRWGEGNPILLCLHGYGETGLQFEGLARLLINRYSILAPDLPLHGNTQWNEGCPLTPEMLMEMLSALLPSTQRISVAGYSMGGRMAMKLVEKFPDRFLMLFLLAPDGLSGTWWRKLLTGTATGRSLFGWSMSHPGLLLKLITWARQLHLMPAPRSRFVLLYLARREDRAMLLSRWICLGKFFPHLPPFAHAAKNSVRVLAAFGVHDSIIPRRNGAKLQRLLPAAKVSYLQSGHLLLKDKHLPKLAALLQDRLL